MRKVTWYRHTLLILLANLMVSTSTLAQPTAQQLLVRTPVAAPNPEQTNATRDWLAARKIIKVAVWGDVAYPPFDLHYQNDQFEGLIADYLGVLQQSLNVRLEIQRFPDKNAAEQALLMDEVDILALHTGGTTGHGRLLSSHPYLINHTVILRRTNEVLDTSDNLTDKRVGISAEDDIIARVQSEYPNARLIRYDSASNAFGALVYGQVDALWSDAASAEYLLKRAYFNRAVINEMARPLRFDTSFAVSAHNKPLLDGINTVLDAIRPAARIRIASRWRLGEEYTRRSNPLALTSEESNWITRHADVRVVISGAYAPLTFFDNKNELQGLAADILQRIHERTGLRFSILRSDNQQDSVDMLKNAEADLIPALNAGDTRSDGLLFSRPYMVNPFVVVTKAGTPPLMDIAQLQGKKISITEGNPLTPWIVQSYPNIHLRITTDPAHGIEMLHEGKVDASINPQINADYFIQHYFPTSLRINSNIGPQGAHIAMATSSEQPVLMSIINKALLDIPPEETANLADRWRSHFTPATASSWSNYQYVVYQVLGVAAFFVLVFVLWNSYLRKQINRRIKAERALKNQLEFSRTLIDGSPIALYVRDHLSRLIQCNQAYLDFFHVNAEQVLGKTLPESPVMTLAFNEQYHALYQKTLQDGSPTMSDLEVPVGDQLFNIYHWTLPFQDSEGQLIGIIGGWLDITERQHLLQKLQQAKEAADSANHTKSIFLTSMSHEIRTPMNAIVGLLELLQLSDSDADQNRERLALAHQAAQSLLSLIGDILDLSKIESGAMQPSPRPTHLPSLLNTVFKLFESSASRKGLKSNLIIEINHPWVMIDSLMLKQIVSNLLSNAIKFTERGSIELALFEEWAPQSPQQGRYAIQVTDTGVGLSDSDIKAVFEPFVQVCNEKMAQNGSGLGLSICRRLADLLGGSLNIESTMGKSSTISLEFNAPYCAEASTPASVLTSTLSRGIRVLVADDHATNRLLLCQQLEFLGHQAEAAEDGAKALDIWAVADPMYDLLITDCDMPNMDGLSLARNVRRLEIQRSLMPMTIIGLTANAQTEALQQCLNAGMSDCLFKPLNIDTLAERVGRFFPDTQDPQTTLHAPPLNAFAGIVDRETLLREAIRSNNLDAQQLQSCASQHDMQHLYKLAHRIMGAAKYVEGDDVVAACEKLQACISLGDEELSMRQTDVLLRTIRDLEVKLTNKLNETGAKSH